MDSDAPFRALATAGPLGSRTSKTRQPIPKTNYQWRKMNKIFETIKERTGSFLAAKLGMHRRRKLGSFTDGNILTKIWFETAPDGKHQVTFTQHHLSVNSNKVVESDSLPIAECADVIQACNWINYRVFPEEEPLLYEEKCAKERERRFKPLR